MSQGERSATPSAVVAAGALKGETAELAYWWAPLSAGRIPGNQVATGFMLPRQCDVGLWNSGGFKAPQTHRRSVPNDGASPPGHSELQHPGLQLFYLLQYAYWLDRL